MPRVFHQQNDCGKQNGNRPPQSKAEFPDQLGHTSELTEPFKQPPNVRGASNAEGPGNRAGQPQRPAVRLVLAQFLRSQPHAELRAAGESAREGNCCRAQRPQRLLGLPRELRAARTFPQVRAEPLALGLRKPLHALFRDEFVGARMQIGAHAVPPGSTPRSASSPRYSRDFTVETGMESTPAISSIRNSS